MLRLCSCMLILSHSTSLATPPIAFVFVLFVCLSFLDSRKKMRQQTSRLVWARRLHSLVMPHSFIRACLPFYNSVRFIFPKSVFILGDFKLECISRAQKAQNNDPALWFSKTRKALCSLLTLCSLKVTFPMFLKSIQVNQWIWFAHTCRRGVLFGMVCSKEIILDFLFRNRASKYVNKHQKAGFMCIHVNFKKH